MSAGARRPYILNSILLRRLSIAVSVQTRSIIYRSAPTPCGSVVVASPFFIRCGEQREEAVVFGAQGTPVRTGYIAGNSASADRRHGPTTSLTGPHAGAPRPPADTGRTCPAAALDFRI